MKVQWGEVLGVILLFALSIGAFAGSVPCVWMGGEMGIVGLILVVGGVVFLVMGCYIVAEFLSRLGKKGES